MLMNRWNGGSVSPFGLGRIGAEVDRVFHDVLDRFAEGTSWGHLPQAFPAINLWEDEQNLYLEAELPGVASDAVELTVTGRQLSLHGERMPSAREQGYFRQERSVGRFERVLELPVAIEDGAVQASLANGLLSMTLPKAAEARPRKIAVQQTNPEPERLENKQEVK